MNSVRELILSKINTDYEKYYLNGSSFTDVVNSFFLRLKNE